MMTVEIVRENKAWNDKMGFSDVIAEEDGKVLVRFDADPWCPTWAIIIEAK